MMQQKHEKTKYRNQNIAKYAQENSQKKKEEFNAPKKNNLLRLCDSNICDITKDMQNYLREDFVGKKKK